MTTVETVKRLNLLQTHKFKIVPAYSRADKALLVLEIIIKQSERIDVEVAHKVGTDVVNVPYRATQHITTAMSLDPEGRVFNRILQNSGS